MVNPNMNLSTILGVAIIETKTVYSYSTLCSLQNTCVYIEDITIFDLYKMLQLRRRSFEAVIRIKTRAKYKCTSTYKMCHVWLRSKTEADFVGFLADQPSNKFIFDDV